MNTLVKIQASNTIFESLVYSKQYNEVKLKSKFLTILSPIKPYVIYD